MWFLLAVLSVVTLGSQLVAAQCVYEQSLSPGVVYQVFSPGYASNYVSGLACSWTATVPTGYKAELSCGNVAVPCPAPSPAASDSFVINQFGEKNPHWTDNRYCGSGSFSLPTIQSIGTKLNVRLTTGTNTGRFYCELKAVRTQTWNSCSCGTKLVSYSSFPWSQGWVLIRHYFPDYIPYRWRDKCWGAWVPLPGHACSKYGYQWPHLWSVYR